MIRLARGLVEAGHKVSLLLPDSWLSSESGGAGRFKDNLGGFNLIGFHMPEGVDSDMISAFHFITEEYGIRVPWNVMKKMIDFMEDGIYEQLEGLETQAFDYAVLDIFSLRFAATLQEIGIDICVNLPGPAALLWLFEHEGTEDRSWMPWRLWVEFFFLKNTILSSSMADHKENKSCIKPWLVNSFPALEIIPDGKLPDYCEYTGSLVEAGGGTLHAEFAAFMSSNEPVVCVSLGSMLVPDRVIVNALYEALAGGPWKVVWSLKKWSIQEYLPSGIDETRFLISPWIPQAAVLAHPNCKAFITHGGWGGIMEAAATAMPSLVLPFFGDQPTNAMLAEKAGWGLALPNQNANVPGCCQEPPEYTGKLNPEEVREKVHRLLDEPSFREAAARAQQGSNECGGSQKAAQIIIEWASLSKSGSLPEPDQAECRCF